MKTLRRAVIPFSVIAALGLVSCAGDKKESSPASAAVPTLSQRINEKTGFTQDSQGNWKPQVNRRSSFESKGESPYFKGEYAGKEYKTGDYAKKAWLGNKSVDRKAYQGDTDGSRFMKNSRFDGQSAREGSQSAREASQTANEGAQTYATGEAREAKTKRLPKPVDAESAGKAYPQQDIIDWQQQRSLSVEQTKGLLGHD